MQFDQERWFSSSELGVRSSEFSALLRVFVFQNQTNPHSYHILPNS